MIPVSTLLALAISQKTAPEIGKKDQRKTHIGNAMDSLVAKGLLILEGKDVRIA